MTKDEIRQLEGRRVFLKGSAAVGLASVATAIGASTKAQAETNSTPPACAPAFLRAPEPIPDSKISRTVTTDVVVIGSALSGLSAARAALEGGAKVAVIEKAPDIVYRSTDVGTIGSSVAKKAGVSIDKAEVINAVQDGFGHRANGGLWRYWAENSGAALDWWLSLVPNYRFIDEEFVIPDKTDDVYVRIPHWPAPKAYNPSTEHYKVFPVGVQLLPNMGGPLRAVYKRCVEMGAQFSFSTWARQLIRPNNEGRVQGVIAQDKDGNYIKYIANKGVVLCTGDYSGDTEMLRYYLPDTAKLYPPVDFLYQKDANGVTCHTGDGHKMGMWVGGQMEPGPHAPMTHNMGGPLGTDAFLLVNVRGQRFMNEDTDGQNFTNAIERQPKAAAFQIFDDNWRDQLACQGIGHGQKSSIKKEFSKGKAALAFTSFVTEGSIQAKAKQSDTLEGLAKELGLPVDSFIATLKRYNELARAGKDADYYKRADRMFPIEKAPFYGGRTMAYLLVVMSGLETNEKCEVLDQNYNTILGLYAAGNAQGGRFSIDYPMTCVGVSHGMALTFGRLAGTEAAKG